jgi:hypothetical protein
VDSIKPGKSVATNQAAQMTQLLTLIQNNQRSTNKQNTQDVMMLTQLLNQMDGLNHVKILLLQQQIDRRFLIRHFVLEDLIKHLRFYPPNANVSNYLNSIETRCC